MRVLRAGFSEERVMSMDSKTEYQAPTIKDIGSLHEVTLTNKVFAHPSDYHYPHHLSFNFST
jgi:hypothetical protein